MEIRGLEQASAVGSSTGSSAVTMFAAPGAGYRWRVTDISIDNESASNSSVIVKSASTTLWRHTAPSNGSAAGGGGVERIYQTPLKGGDNEAITFTPTTAVTTLYVSMAAFKEVYTG